MGANSKGLLIVSWSKMRQVSTHYVKTQETKNSVTAALFEMEEYYFKSDFHMKYFTVNISNLIFTHKIKINRNNNNKE